jgi:hypothetical protein
MPILFTLLRLVRRAGKLGYLSEEECDILPLMSTPSEQIMQTAERRWAEESSKPNPKLSRVLWAAVKEPFLIGFVCATIRGCANAFAMPLLLKQIIDSLVDGDLDRAGFFLGFLLAERFVGSILEYVAGYKMSGQVTGLFSNTITGLIAQKASTPGVQGLKSCGVSPTPLVGRELSMVVQMMGFILRFGFVATPTLFAGSATLILLLGWPSLLGIAWICFTIRLGFTVQTAAKKA